MNILCVRIEKKKAFSTSVVHRLFSSLLVLEYMHDYASYYITTKLHRSVLYEKSVHYFTHICKLFQLADESKTSSLVHSHHQEKPT